MTDAPPIVVGMFADEPGTIKPLPRARGKGNKRPKRRVLIGSSLRKKKRS